MIAVFRKCLASVDAVQVWSRWSGPQMAGVRTLFDLRIVTLTALFDIVK
jgi:hypothetical protein